MGDLNEWFLWGRPLRWLHRHFENTPAPATFPSRLPVLALDRIWVKPRHLLRQLTVHTSRLARRASDHLPLVAEIAVETAVPESSAPAKTASENLTQSNRTRRREISHSSFQFAAVSPRLCGR